MYIYTNVCHAPRNCIVGHEFSTLNLFAMDSSAIGVGIAVLVGKCMQGPEARCLIFEYQIVRKLS